jgi:hypothetical protein
MSVQGQGGRAFQPAGILVYFEELKHETNTEIGLKDIFEIRSLVKCYIATINDTVYQ